MKIKTLLVTMLFALSMWAQNAAPSTPDQGKTQSTASCCKDGAACCKSGAGCCNGKDAASCKEGAKVCKAGAGCCGDSAKAGSCCKEGAACCKAGAECCAKMAKNDNVKGCCGGKMCARHKGQKA